MSLVNVKIHYWFFNYNIVKNELKKNICLKPFKIGLVKIKEFLCIKNKNKNLFYNIKNIKYLICLI